MWLESPQVQSVLTEKQVQTWDSIKNDVQDHIIRYDSRGIEYILKDEQLAKEEENPNHDKYVNHSGGAVGSDSYWGAIGEKYSVVSQSYNNGDKAQIQNADAIFAVGHLKNGIVDGSTGQTVQMAIDDNKPVYVYDQIRKQWFANLNGQWQVFSGIPKLTKNFAGIGTRELNQDGKDAIKQVYENTFNEEEMFDDSKFDQSNMDHCKK